MITRSAYLLEVRTCIITPKKSNARGSDLKNLKKSHSRIPGGTFPRGGSESQATGRGCGRVSLTARTGRALLFAAVRGQRYRPGGRGVSFRSRTYSHTHHI